VMRNINCEKVRSLLSAYLDRELDYHELRQVELHLMDCESCQEECRSLRATKDLLGMLDTPELPREFWPELKERINSHSRSGIYSGLLVKVLVPAAALLALTILPLTLATRTGASKGMTQAKTDLVEPTSGLDPISTLRIEELLWELVDRYTIVLVTHNPLQAARIDSRTAFFLMGELVETGSAYDIFTRPKDKRTEDYVSGKFG
jgi:hypothetical protein